ncbi:hypothetical protein GWI33_006414 [Rhynchophorus ferrugineus]|uniref:Uncharacterized protein n=1 Tax=Rhynchophorus ferrugineus TaxID=354439 RepID=A0A834IKD8_RHYFE|nr:hypothetical protein GWI33_006414 [Rhynchophorus ferrugineus]
MNSSNGNFNSSSRYQITAIKNSEKKRGSESSSGRERQEIKNQGRYAVRVGGTRKPDGAPSLAASPPRAAETNF